MIVLLSDLHITDGSTARNVDPGAYELLKEEILLNVRKKKTTEVHVVLDRILAAPDGSGQALISMLDSLALHPEIAGLPLPLTYVVGNHDKAFNTFVSLQEELRLRFPHRAPTFALSVVAPEYGLLARHGHEWDEQCHAKAFWERVLHNGTLIDRFDPNSRT
ncbi:MAG: hypothetical protein C4326_13940 [Ignavibacteria bacterium]